MQRRHRLIPIFAAAAVSLALLPTALAQSWEVGGGAGGSFYKNRSVTGAPGGDATAGFDNGFTGTFYASQSMGRWLNGEIRYQYQQQDLKVEQGSVTDTFKGRSHAVTYEFVIHVKEPDAKIRPYFFFGGGVKGYQGVGSGRAFPPLGDVVALTPTTEWKGLMTFGGGVKFHISDHVILRVEVRDNFSQFPKEVVAPIPPAQVGDWIHNIVPMVMIGYVF